MLFPTTDDFRGKMVPVIRARIPTPKGNGQGAKAPDPKLPPDLVEAPDELDDEIDF